MKTVVVCNQKGGTGKSLIADELAFSFERSGIPISFYDLDEQGGTIHKTAENQDAQVAVVDTPGALVDDLKSAIAHADVIVIPVRPSGRDMDPVLRMRKIVQGIAPKVPVMYVINAWNRHKVCTDFFAWFTGEIGAAHTLPQSEAFAQAGVAGVSVVAHSKDSQAARSTLLLCNAVRKILDFDEEINDD